MSFNQNQGMNQPPYQQSYIIPQENVVFQKSNRIIDQRDYNGNLRQTSDGGDDYQFQNNRQQNHPQSYMASQINMNQPNQNQQPNIPPPVQPILGQGQPQNSQINGQNNNFQSQSIFQSSAIPDNKQVNQSQIKQNNQVGFQNQPIAQSYIPEKPKNVQNEINQPFQNNINNNDQNNNSSQQMQFQRPNNSQYKSSNTNQQLQPNLSGNQLQFPRDQANPNIKDRPLSSRSYSNAPQNNNSNAINFNENNQTNRGKQQQQQYNSQLGNDQNNQNWQQQNQNDGLLRQESQFPQSHQYYNKSLLEELSPPYQPEQDYTDNSFSYYAQFFQACGYSLDTLINDEQAYQVLNTPAIQFDQDVMQQLKEQINIEESSQYTVRQFLEVYMQAINILEDKKIKEENVIKAAKDKQTELINLQEQARLAEINRPPTNQSILYVYIDQARGLDRSSQYIVRLNFDFNQTITTNQSEYSNSPSFNEEFKLKINNPNSILSFQLEDVVNNRVIGLVTQKLKQFYHQKRIDEWYILEDQGGALGDINRQIAIAIQWVHSERLLYENILKENDYFEPVIKDYEEKLISSIDMLRVLRHPFERDLEQFKQEQEDLQKEKTKKTKNKGGYKRGNNDADDKDNSKHQEDNGESCWDTCMGLFSDNEPEQNINKNTQINQQQTQSNQIQTTQSDLESLISLKNNLVHAFTICAIIVCFFRPNFIDVCLALVFLSKYIELNYQNCNRLSIILVVSIFLDLLWMSLFTRNWFSYAGDSTFQMIIFIIVEVIATIFKVILGIVLQKLKEEDIHHKNQQNQQIQQQTNNILNQGINYQHQHV